MDINEQAAQVRKALERLGKKLAEAERERNDCIYRRRNMAAAARAQSKMDAIKEQMKEFEDAMPRPLSELVSKSELKKAAIVEKIVAVHLAADFLCDAASELKSALGRLGLQGCSLFPSVRQIEKLTNDFVFSACGPEFAGLGDFLIGNERLIRDLTALTMAYIGEHLDFKDRKTKNTNPKND